MIEVTDGSTRGVLFTNQKRYEGYCIDLIEEIANYWGFKFEFELVEDKQYGKYNPVTKTWNGLIRRLLDRVRCFYTNLFKPNCILFSYQKFILCVTTFLSYACK